MAYNYNEAKQVSDSKRKFYMNNRDVFMRYFESANQYQSLIDGGNFKKLEEIIREESDFDFDDWVASR